ncbi:MAG: hypothetical protein PHT16_00015 [Candidatus Pacebacteria bacterium]|nr:hypothetical protein [Candidatus Paceibacterota bacterium]
MKKKIAKKEEVTNTDLGRMMQGLGSGIKSLDLRISRMESYMKEGFTSLDNKVDHIDARLSNQIEGLGRRMDDFADNKVSRITYKELEHRVITLESKVLPKAKK